MNPGSAEPGGARPKADLAAARGELGAKADAPHAFRVHLSDEKFCGTAEAVASARDADGDRRPLGSAEPGIAVADVLAWLDCVRAAQGLPGPAAVRGGG